MDPILGVIPVAGQVVYGSFQVDNVPIPLVLAAGAKPGPRLVVHCAQHAVEYPGSSMVPLLLRSLDLGSLHGTVAIVPLCNIPHIYRTRLPEIYQPLVAGLGDSKGAGNPNRNWPGKADGSWIQRLTHTLSFGLFAGSAAVLDYHSCRICDPNFTSYLKGHAASRELALAFGLAAVDEMPLEGHFPGQLHRAIAHELNTPAILIEMTPTASQVLWAATQQALAGAINVLRHLEMIDGTPHRPPVQVVFHRCSETATLSAGQIGFAVTYFGPGELVKKGELVAEIRSPRDFSVLEEHRAPYDGGLASCGPGVHHFTLPGEELATIQPGVEVIRN